MTYVEALKLQKGRSPPEQWRVSCSLVWSSSRPGCPPHWPRPGACHPGRWWQSQSTRSPRPPACLIDAPAPPPSPPAWSASCPGLQLSLFDNLCRPWSKASHCTSSSRDQPELPAGRQPSCRGRWARLPSWSSHSCRSRSGYQGGQCRLLFSPPHWDCLPQSRSLYPESPEILA